jgi:tetratricopeptide (TPR) repeat protein
MKISAGKIVLILLVAVAFSVSVKTAFGQNSISGIIFNSNRQPVAKIDVELLDEFERLIKSTQTTGSGLYIFQGLRSGIYYVQVRTAGTNYRESKERIQVGQLNRVTSGGLVSGSESLQLDFVLQIDRRGNNTEIPINNEVVFAQNVPKEAEKFYENALKKIKEEKHDDAIAELENALKVFPEYYLALDKCGYEYLAKAKFVESEDAFTKALRVYPKSFSSKSGLGIAEYKLGKREEAAKTLEESIALDQSLPSSFLFLGKIYRELKQFEKAETSLKKANELGKSKIADVHWELALLYYYNLNRPANAADELELYLKAKPDADNRPQIEKLIKTMREKAKEKS